MITKISACAALAAAALAGCISYGPQQVASMPTYDICELQMNQAPNLTGATRSVLAAELARRRERCAPHVAAIQAVRDADLHFWVYENEHP